MFSKTQLLLAALSLLSAATAQDITSGPINGNGISCVGDNACCSGTVRGTGSDAVCCPEESGGNIIGGQGTTCATGTGVPLTAGVTITAGSAAATGSGDSSSSAEMTMTTSASLASASTEAASSGATSGTSSGATSASAATTSSGSGAVKTMAAMGPAALGMGAMAVVFGGM